MDLDNSVIYDLINSEIKSITMEFQFPIWKRILKSPVINNFKLWIKYKKKTPKNQPHATIKTNKQKVKTSKHKNCIKTLEREKKQAILEEN